MALYGQRVTPWKYEPQFQEGERENGQWHELFVRFLTEILANGLDFVLRFNPLGMLNVKGSSRFSPTS